MDWCEIIISAAEKLRDPISNFLFEQGAEGVTENGSGPSGTLHAYFKKEESQKVAEEIQTYFHSLAEMFPDEPAPSLQVVPLKNENWGEKYKEFYTAQPLGDRFFLRPLWDTQTPIPSDRIPIFMEPGQAFGTGLHSSTRLCIRLIEKALEQWASPDQVRTLDVGTGTGILAIVAAKLGVKSIAAIDNDPVAVETAVENLEVNQCTFIELSGTDLGLLKGPYDLIISNILLETHRQLAPHYFRLLAPGGILILSGLLGEQRAAIDEVMRAAGFTLDQSDAVQEWAAFMYRPNSKK